MKKTKQFDCLKQVFVKMNLIWKRFIIFIDDLVCRWIIGASIRTAYGSNTSYYQILPLACLLESYEADEELSKTCSSLLATLSCVPILEKHVQDLINAIKLVNYI